MAHAAPGNRTAARLRIELLGGFRLSVDGTSMVGQVGPRVQSLLGWLVLHAGVPQSRERLAGIFWPDASPEAARSNLRKLIHHLRQQLPGADSPLVTTRGSITFRITHETVVDVLAFREALQHLESSQAVAHAVSLYGGEFLPDCYDDWVFAEQEALHNQFLQLLERGIMHAQAEGESHAAIAYALRLLREEPLREETYRTLMRLRDAAGDRAGAVQTYHRCASILERELGVEPAPETRAAYESLIQAEKENAPNDAGAKPQPSRGVRRASLVGRGDEREALREAWRQAVQGSPGVIMLVGEPGIGKTRLLEDMRDRVAPRGIRTAWTRCYAPQGTSLLAFASIASIVRSIPVPQLDALWLSELARFRPALLAERPDVPTPGPITESWQRHKLFEAIARFLLAAQPLLLVIDDMQWIDEDSLQLLEYLVQFQSDARLLIAGGVRPEGKGTEDVRSTLFSELRASGQMREIEVQPLGHNDATELARSALDDGVPSEHIERLVRDTEGNPLFILEMGRADPRESLPPSLRAVIEARLSRLSIGAQEVAGIAAVMGRGFRVPVLLAAAAEDENAVVRSLDELWRHRIVREQGGDSYDFSHDRIRDVAYDRLSAARRLLLHRQVGKALEEVHEDDPARVSADLARHFVSAHDREKAAQYYAMAGDEAQRLYANQAAIEHYQRAIELERTANPPVLLRLGIALRTMGRSSEAIGSLDGAWRGARDAGDMSISVRASIVLGRVLNEVGRQAEARTMLQRAREEARASNLPTELALAAVSLGVLYRVQGQWDDALRYLEEARDAARDSADPRARIEVLGELCVVRAWRGDHSRAVVDIEAALSLARESGNLRALMFPLSNLGLYYILRMEPREALPYLLEAERAAHECGDLFEWVRNMINTALAYGLLDEHQTALESFRSVLGSPVLRDDVAGLVVAGINIGMVYRRAGEIELCVRWTEVSIARAEGLQMWMVVGAALAQLARAYHLGGDTRDSAPLLDRSLTLLQSENMRFHLPETLYFQADLYRSRGHLERARAACGEAIRIGKEAHRLDFWFAAELLSIFLDGETGRADRASQVTRLSEMLQHWPDAHDQAALHYELWRLIPRNEEHQRAAAELYASMHARAPVELYRTRHRELTGKELPPTPPLPDLPLNFDPETFDLGRTLAWVDEHLSNLERISQHEGTVAERYR